MRASTTMIRDVLIVPPELTLATAWRVQMRVRRILAVHDRELRGIVSGFDLVRVMTL